MSEILLYSTDDGRSRVELRVKAGTAWMTQAQLAELFQTSVQNISLHIRNLRAEGELEEQAVVKESLITAADGKAYQTRLHSLELILAVGFRVRSPRGVQFRRWANTQLREYLTKGFVMDDERLKDPGGWDHFDELLARIREIRASEKRFYQKVRDLFALSSDDAAAERDTQLFFAEVQNKLLHAATGHTAAELVQARADADAPNMGLTSWKGSRVRKGDVATAKNYLSDEELDTLNRLVVIFLDQAELRVKKRNDLTLAFWRENVDALLRFNDHEVLRGHGSVSQRVAQQAAEKRFAAFDRTRTRREAAEADAEDLRRIERLEDQLKKKKKEKPDG